MNNEPNKPIEAEELTEKELEGFVGGECLPEELKKATSSSEYFNQLFDIHN